MEFRASDNLADQIATYLSDRIIRLKLKPGERILEAKLALELQVSRAPIREALRILEKNRLVELIPRRGARVTSLSEEGVTWLYDVLKELYALMARKGIENGSDEDFKLLREAYQQIEDSAERRDVEGYFDAIFNYGRVALKAAKNPILENLIIELWPSNRRIQFASLTFRLDELKTNAGHFQQTLLCAEERNIPLAEKTIRDLVELEKHSALKMIRTFADFSR